MKPHADGGVTFESTAEVSVLATGLRAMLHVSELACMPLLRDGSRALLKSIRHVPGATAREPREKTAAKFLRNARPVVISINDPYKGTFASEAVEVVATAPLNLADFPELVDPVRSAAAAIMLEKFNADKAAGSFHMPPVPKS
jgi:hypothetical protein